MSSAAQVAAIGSFDQPIQHMNGHFGSSEIDTDDDGFTDYAEVFLQHRTSDAVQFEDGVVNDASVTVDLGAGFLGGRRII